MVDSRQATAIRKEKQRIINILATLPVPINPHLTRSTINDMFAKAETRARVTVMSKHNFFDEEESKS